MNRIVLGTMALVGIAIAQAPKRRMDLSTYRNRNRVLIVFAPSPKDPRYVRESKALRAPAAEFEDRDLVRIDAFAREATVNGKPTEADPASLRGRFDVHVDDFRVILIGKDGHTALETKDQVDAKGLFGQIDAMPMRKREMRQRGGSSS